MYLFLFATLSWIIRLLVGQFDAYIGPRKAFKGGECGKHSLTPGLVVPCIAVCFVGRQDGLPRKVVGTSCVAVVDFGEEGEASEAFCDSSY